MYPRISNFHGIQEAKKTRFFFGGGGMVEVDLGEF